MTTLQERSATKYDRNGLLSLLALTAVVIGDVITAGRISECNDFPFDELCTSCATFHRPQRVPRSIRNFLVVEYCIMSNQKDKPQITHEPTHIYGKVCKLARSLRSCIRRKTIIRLLTFIILFTVAFSAGIHFERYWTFILVCLCPSLNPHSLIVPAEHSLHTFTPHTLHRPLRPSLITSYPPNTCFRCPREHNPPPPRPHRHLHPLPLPQPPLLQHLLPLPPRPLLPPLHNPLIPPLRIHQRRPHRLQRPLHPPRLRHAMVHDL